MDVKPGHREAATEPGLSVAKTLERRCRRDFELVAVTAEKGTTLRHAELSAAVIKRMNNMPVEAVLACERPLEQY
jgi:hypothetical protein